MGLRHGYLRIRIRDDEIECVRQFLIFLGVTERFCLFAFFSSFMASLNGPPKFKAFFSFCLVFDGTCLCVSGSFSQLSCLPSPVADLC